MIKMIGYDAAYLLHLVPRLSGGGEKESLVSTVSIHVYGTCVSMQTAGK